MANFHFKQGFTYAAGVDKPMVLSKATVVEGITDLGFRVLFADECEVMPRFPFRVPGKCGDEWDWVGYAERTGPSQTIDVPGRVKWIQEIPRPRPAPLPGQPIPPPEPIPPSWINPDPSESVPASITGSNGSTLGSKGSMVLPILIGSAAGILLVRWLKR